MRAKAVESPGPGGKSSYILRSKRFRLVSEQKNPRGTGFSVFRAVFYFVRRSLLLNRTETFATQAKARIAQRFWREMLGNLSHYFHGRKARRELHSI